MTDGNQHPRVRSSSRARNARTHVVERIGDLDDFRGARGGGHMPIVVGGVVRRTGAAAATADSGEVIQRTA